jgi:hypothetical protein
MTLTRILILTVLALVLIGGVAPAQQAPPLTPAPPTASTLPDWVAKYAGLQEQAARACQLQLAQEQTKLEALVKELADAKATAAKASPEKK